MESGKTLKELIALFQDKKIERTECEKLSLASLILVEGIILGHNATKLIPTSSLQEALNFEDYIRKPWGKIGFDSLRTNILKMSVNSWTKKTHDVEGFGWAIQFWALCSVPHLCIIFGKQDETTTTSEYPLMLGWTSTETPRVEQILKAENTYNIMVKTIIGDPEKHKNLVPPTDCRDNTFMEIVEWVKNGNRLKKADWINGYVYFCDATEDIGNVHRKKDLSLDQKVDMLTQMVQLLTNKVNSIENLMK